MKLEHPYGIIQLEVSDDWQDMPEGLTLFSLVHETGSYWLSSTPVPKPGNFEDLDKFTDNVLTVYRDQMKSMRNVTVKDVKIGNLPAKRIDFDEFAIKALQRKSIKIIVEARNYFVIFNAYWKKESDKIIPHEIVENLPSYLTIHDLDITDPYEIFGKFEEDASDNDDEDEYGDLEEEPEPIPELLEALKKPETVEAIDLSQKFFSDIPEELAQLTNLKSLDLSQNYFIELPDFITKLTKLEKLYLISCPIRTLPDWIGELKNLKELYLANCYIVSLPDSLKKLKKLKVLNLNGNELLGEIPDVIGQLKQLKRLDLYKCSLEKIRDDLFKDIQLNHLELGQNAITSLPRSLFNQDKLAHLNMNNNKLTHINYPWSTLKSLKLLDLSNNNLGTLPSNLFEIKSLHSLMLTNCNLSSIDSAIGNLSNLERLWLEGNDFKSLPSCMKDMNEVDIEISRKYKALYEDIAYKAQKPESPITDKEIYARYDKNLIALLNEKMDDKEWDPVRDGLIAIALKGIGIKSAEPCTEKDVGSTKLGGSPDLPAEIPYPSEEDGTLWTFVAQLKLDDFKQYNDFLPKRGYLWFFVKDQDEFEPLVLFGDYETKDLVPFELDDEMAFFDYDLDDFYPCYVTEIKPYPSLPPFYSEDFIFTLEGAEKLMDHLDFLEENISETLDFSPFEEMGYGNDVHTINTYLFSQNESPQALAAEERGGEEKDWIVLLSLGHDNNTGFCFWDAGTLYFLIHKDDLANRDFSKIYCGLESS